MAEGFSGTETDIEIGKRRIGGNHGTLSADLICTVCSRIFTDPCTLICGHSFCMDCIKGWATMQSTGNRYTSLSAPHMVQFSCPHCKRTYPRCSLESVKINIVLRNLCLDHKKQLQDLDSGTSSQSLHRDNPIGSVTELGDFCDAHPTEEASFVCLSCQVVFCPICSVIEKLHASENHTVVHKKDADEALMEVLRERRLRLEELQSKAAHVNETIALRKSDLSLLEQEINKRSEQLKTRFEKVIDDCREESVQKIERKRDEYVKLLSKDSGGIETDLLKLTLETEKDFQGARIGEMLKFLSHFITESTKLNQEFQGMQIRQNMPDTKFQGKQAGFHQKKMAHFLSETFVLLEENDDRETEEGACFCKMESSEVRTHVSGKTKARKGKQRLSDGIVDNGQALGQPVSKGKVRPQNANHKGIVKDNQVYPVSLGKFEAAEDYNLCDIAWLVGHIAVVNLKDGKIYVVDIGNGNLKLFVDSIDLRDRPLGLSATMDNSVITVIVDILSPDHTPAHVVLKGPKNNLTKTGTKKWNKVVTYLSKFGCTHAKVFFNVLCGIFSDGKVLVGDANTMKWNFESKYPVSGQPEYIAVGRSGNTSKLYVKSQGNVVESFIANEQESTTTRYDTSKFRDVCCLAPDRRGNLWLVDKSRNLLAYFSGDGCLQRYYHLAIKGEICSMNVSINNILVLVKKGRSALIYKIPLQSLGNLSPSTP